MVKQLAREFLKTVCSSSSSSRTCILQVDGDKTNRANGSPLSEPGEAVAVY